MSATYNCRSVVLSVNIFVSVFVCEFTFGQLSVDELSYNSLNNSQSICM